MKSIVKRGASTAPRFLKCRTIAGVRKFLKSPKTRFSKLILKFDFGVPIPLDLRYRFFHSL